MQPLYFFNVKPQKSLEDHSEEEPKKPIKNYKEASTPFFLGSPVNNSDNAKDG
jgi:hypothetical protein